jgi:hypothetical protein
MEYGGHISTANASNRKIKMSYRISRILIPIPLHKYGPNARCRTMYIENSYVCTFALYKLYTSGGVLDVHHKFVRTNYAPSIVKFFGWLAVRSRVQCQSNLLRKGILAAADSGCPICAVPLKTEGCSGAPP